MSTLSLAVKRVLDVAGAAVLLVAAAPVLLAAMAAVRLAMGAPVLYRPLRHGRDGRPFRQLKLRTMRPAGQGREDVAHDGDRLTPLGRILRATSVDELPQLWNVLRGDMSLVGPRPLLPQYVARYTAEQARRLGVRPGLTGLVQVSGRNALDWDEKLALDAWYATHRTLALDLWILWRTPWVVLRATGVSAGGQATTTEFMGSARPGLGTAAPEER